MIGDVQIWPDNDPDEQPRSKEETAWDELTAEELAQYLREKRQ